MLSIVITGLHEMEMAGETQTGAEKGGKDGARQGQTNWWRRTTSIPSSLNKRKPEPKHYTFCFNSRRWSNELRFKT